MSSEIINYMLSMNLAKLFEKHKIFDIVFHDEDMYAVYYDEMNDKLKYIPVEYTIIHEVNGMTVYRPVLDDTTRPPREWIFIELSDQIKPQSDYGEAILEKLVTKVRLYMNGY